MFSFLLHLDGCRYCFLGIWTLYLPPEHLWYRPHCILYWRFVFCLQSSNWHLKISFRSIANYMVVLNCFLGEFAILLLSMYFCYRILNSVETEILVLLINISISLVSYGKTLHFFFIWWPMSRFTLVVLLPILKILQLMAHIASTYFLPWMFEICFVVVIGFDSELLGGSSWCNMRKYPL